MKIVTLTALTLALIGTGPDSLKAQSFSVGAFGGWNSAWSVRTASSTRW